MPRELRHRLPAKFLIHLLHHVHNLLTVGAAAKDLQPEVGPVLRLRQLGEQVQQLHPAFRLHGLADEVDVLSPSARRLVETWPKALAHGAPRHVEELLSHLADRLKIRKLDQANLLHLSILKSGMDLAVVSTYASTIYVYINIIYMCNFNSYYACNLWCTLQSTSLEIRIGLTYITFVGGWEVISL